MQDLRIVFLGTSAAMPSRERNVAGVALVTDGRVLLFDCGEGTQHQLLRADGVRSGALDAIFISHLHGDHVYGLPGLLASLSLNARVAPLTLYGPRGLRAYVESALATTQHNPIFPLFVAEESEHRGDGYRVDFAPVDHTTRCLAWRFIEDDRPGRFDVDRARELGVPAGPLYAQLQRGEDVTIGDRIVRAADVVGPSRPGRRVVYCTDTRPCAAAIELARGADVLIHESTYGAEMQEEARDRAHSTSVDAARIAAEAGVGQLWLTHFSTRYTDVEPLVNEARAVFPHVTAAADFACVAVERPL
ncbi:MAG TPA: ribonuclease Z [Thermoanaerobaculia bacterium]|nr:ribonuclease Z [Thermoanaerobaculia bacterium]